jgi:CTP synthase (UTP-ammonia lyase)
MSSPASPAPARVALVGDRSPHVRAHQRIPGLIDTLCQREGLILDAYWIGSDEVTDPGGLAGFDGIWLLPGSPYRSEAGAIAAARSARERLIPFLGTCGGFQHAVLEFARDVCGVERAGNAEITPTGEDLVIVALPCSLAGHEQAVRVAPGSLAERVLGAERIAARYQCSYGLAPAYRDLLAGHGLVFSGEDDGGDVRIAELPGHPFFLATLFQPELAAEPRPHPIIRAFAAAAAGHARQAQAGPPVPAARP